MRTEASSRYEKGLNPNNSYDALMRAFQLVEELDAGDVIKTFIDADNCDKEHKTVDFDAQWINSFLGTDISESQMIEYLTRLGFEVKDGKVVSPYYRIDIECKADIAEEIARIYGYNNIPSTIIRGVAQAQKHLNKNLKRKSKTLCFQWELMKFQRSHLFLQNILTK